MEKEKVRNQSTTKTIEQTGHQWKTNFKSSSNEWKHDKTKTTLRPNGDNLEKKTNEMINQKVFPTELKAKTK